MLMCYIAHIISTDITSSVQFKSQDRLHYHVFISLSQKYRLDLHLTYQLDCNLTRTSGPEPIKIVKNGDAS